LDNAIFWWTTVMPTRLNNRLAVKRIVVQQRVHEKDLTGHILANDTDHKWVHLRLPLEYEANNPCITVKLPSTNGRLWRDPRRKEGDTLDPKYFTPAVVKELKDELVTEYNISGQLQQRPSPGEGGIIKKRWFKLWPEKQDDGSYPSDALPKLDYIMCSVDTSLSDKSKSAFNVCSTFGIFKDRNKIGNVLLLNMWRKRCEYPEMRKIMLRIAQDYMDDGDVELLHKNSMRKPDMILVEDQSFGKLLIKDLARAGITVQRFQPQGKGSKTERMRVVTPLISEGRVWLPALPPDYKTPRKFADTFREELIKFPRGSSLDIADTLSQALYRLQQSYWIWNQGDFEPVPPRGENFTQEAIY
jgi:phage terminase large subunit-like protein